jgi:hypothetical protein
VLHDRLELPSPDYKTGILPHEITEHKITGSTFKFSYKENLEVFAELILKLVPPDGFEPPLLP